MPLDAVCTCMSILMTYPLYVFSRISTPPLRRKLAGIQPTVTDHRCTLYGLSYLITSLSLVYIPSAVAVLKKAVYEIVHKLDKSRVQRSTTRYRVSLVLHNRLRKNTNARWAISWISGLHIDMVVFIVERDSIQ